MYHSNLIHVPQNIIHHNCFVFVVPIVLSNSEWLIYRNRKVSFHLYRCNDTNWLPLQRNSPVTLQWTRVIMKWLPSHIVPILARCKLTPYNEMTPINPVLQHTQSLLIKPYTLLTTGEVRLLLWTQIEIFSKVNKRGHFLWNDEHFSKFAENNRIVQFEIHVLSHSIQMNNWVV